MKKILLEVISEWLEDFIPSNILHRETAYSKLEDLSEILAIIGPRRAGKTFLMYQMIQELIDLGYKKEEILFIDFEDYRLKKIKDENIEEIFTSFIQLTGVIPKFVFFDEIQHLKNWGRILRTFHNKNKYKIIVSGSNSELLSKEVSTELRGRYSDIQLLPYSYKEFLKLKNITYTERSQYLIERGFLIKAFTEYYSGSSFPEVINKKNNKEQRKLIQNYYNTIFHNDIIDRYNIKAKEVLDELMNYALNTPAELFSISSFEKTLKASNIPASKRTISNYLRYIKDAYFVIVNEKFSYSPKKRMMNPVKMYLMDTGFHLLGVNFSENKGKLLENIVAIELFRREEEVFYYKEKQECDFIIKRNNKADEAIQVCWELNSNNTKRELGALIEVKETLATQNNIILTFEQDNEVEYKGYNFKVIPVWKWLLYN